MNWNVNNNGMLYLETDVRTDEFCKVKKGREGKRRGCGCGAFKPSKYRSALIKLKKSKLKIKK